MDDLTNPNYYTPDSGSEHIVVQEQELTPEQFRGFLLGNARKYDFRKGKKQHIDSDMFIDFMTKLPAGNVAILKDDVVRLFSIWQAETNGRMIETDKSKKAWYLNRLELFNLKTEKA